MESITRLKRIVWPLFCRVFPGPAPKSWREFRELNYWKRRKLVEGNLANDHFKYFYTAHFGLEDSYYAGKIILDVGCGPRCSLAWASMASRRIGLDPLANEYVKLGPSRQGMEYIDSPAENIPIGDAHCDVVSAFNSLDHFDDVARTLSEIKRVTRPGGLFLLLVEVNHPPTVCEPHNLSPQVVDLMKPEFLCEELKVYKASPDGMYESVILNKICPNPYETKENGYLSARFLRV